MISLRGLHRPRFGLIGLGLTAIGALMVAVAFTVLDWVPQVDEAKRVPNGLDVYEAARLYDVSVARHTVALPTVSADYVTWLGWTLLAIVVVISLAAAVPSGRTTWWRLLGGSVGLLGAFATFRAVVDLLARYPSSAAFGDDRANGFSDAHSGAYLALSGFLVCALGAAVGPLGALDRADRAARPVRRSVVGLWQRWHPGRRNAGSLAAAVLAGALLHRAFTGLAWYHQGTDYDEAPNFSFGKLVNIAGDSSVGSLPHAYFPQLAWLLVGTALLAVVSANARTSLIQVIRTIAAVAGLAGMAVTYLALSSLFGTFNNPAGGHDVLHASRIGLWSVFAGFALCVVAGLLAPGPSLTPPASLTGPPGDDGGVKARVGTEAVG